MQHDLSGAASIARALMVLARARATGVLHVHGRAGAARVGFRGGSICAVVLDPDAADSLGDILLAEGALDVETHRRALLGVSGRMPAGRFLIQIGAASRPAVTHALRVQARRRIGRLLAVGAADCRFAAGAPFEGAEPMPEPAPVADLVLRAMRDTVAALPVAVARRAIGHGHLALTALGRALLDRHGAELYPHEAAMLTLLREGASAAALLDIGGNSAAAIRALHAFRLLEAIAAPAPSRRPYALLLRKQRQLRRRAPSHVLLETREDASPAESRRALRRLAVALHPDRFGEGTPLPIRRASTDVLAALLRAEREKE